MSGPEYAASSDGTPIAYWRSGSGPALLLVHGTTADHSRWSRISPAFEQRHTVYAMDRRGRGASGDGKDYSIALEADDILAVIERIGEPVDLLGHSFGALCSLEAARRAENIRRLILYEPALPVGLDIVPPDVLASLNALIAAGDSEAALLLFFREVVHLPEETLTAMQALPAWPARIAAAHTIPRESRVEELYLFDPSEFATMVTPTLMLAGENSPEFLRRATEAVHNALPDSRLVVMPGQQHVAMDSAPELFAKEVEDFLSA